VETNFNKTFNSCPNCGSDFQFFNELGKELTERKLARPEWNMRYEMRQGVVADPAKVELLPPGTPLPAFHITLDVCGDCGTVYAVALARLQGKKTLATPPPNNPKLFRN